jgi:class 3 adenylate cyclase
MTVCRTIRIAGGLLGRVANHPSRWLMGQAQGGAVLIPGVVRQLVSGEEYLFSQRCEAEAKGFEEPVRAWSVEWQA